MKEKILDLEKGTKKVIIFCYLFLAIMAVLSVIFPIKIVILCIAGSLAYLIAFGYVCYCAVVFYKLSAKEELEKEEI